jgi:uncharacterized phiE125 gp8 family phage protein
MPEYFSVLSVPPKCEPVTLKEALTQCHAEKGVEDEWFRARISTGREMVESFVNQSLMPQVWVLTVEGNIPAVIDLPRSPVIELVSLRYQAGPRYEAIGIDLDKAALRNEGLPARLLVPDNYIRRGILRIEYRTGYANPKLMPKEFKEAILLYVSHSYENRAGERELPEAFYNLIEKRRLYL